MRLLDAFMGWLFRKDSRGRLTLAPFGPRGKSYVVPPDRAEAYARFMLRFYGCLIGAIALGGVMFGSRVLVGLIIPAFVAFSLLYSWRFTRGLEVSTDPPRSPRDFFESRPTVARSRPGASEPPPVDTSPARPVPTILVSRRPRGDGADWAAARSWLGGRPRLGNIPWPRTGAARTAMTHVAWIDLRHLSERVPSTPLPREGALAFFIGALDHGLECAVLHVSDIAALDTDPPTDAPPAYTPYGEVFATNDSVGSRTFPRWPIELTPLVALTREETDNPAIIVDRHVPRREFFFVESTARKEIADLPLPNYWQCARHLAACLEAAATKIETLRATRSRYGASPDTLAEFDAGRPAFLEYVTEVVRWASNRRPWDEMTGGEVDRLQSYFTRAKKDFAAYADVWTPSRVKDLETASLLWLASAEDPAAWAALPSAVRDLLDREYLLPTQAWHQMFGTGVDIQGAVHDHVEDHLLLQLVYDDLMAWRFGDVGAFQFWISPANLQQRQWSSAQVTFEAH